MKKLSNSSDPVPLTPNFGWIEHSPVIGAWKIAFTVYGQMPSLKNSRRLLKSAKTGKLFSAKSSAAVKYAQEFYWQVPVEYRNLQRGSKVEPLRLIVTVFYQSYRSDLDIAIVMDCLQAAGVTANDRWIREIHAFAEVDPKNPRCQINLEEL